MIAGLAVRDPDRRATLLDCLDPAIDSRILQSLVRRGPAVDGVTLRRSLTIDGLDLAAHQAMLEQVKAAA